MGTQLIRYMASYATYAVLALMCLPTIMLMLPLLFLAAPFWLTALALLIYVPWEPDCRLGFPVVQSAGTASVPEQVTEHYHRSTVRFPSHGEFCEGWVYTPKARTRTDSHGSRPSRPPIIIMAAGLGAQRDHKLPEFAADFAKAGYAVLLFDYRHWGGSEGEPRQVVSGPRHVEDYIAAAMYVRRMQPIIPASASTPAPGSGPQQAVGLPKQVPGPLRVVLWGTSYSGGHALVAAGRLAAMKPPYHVAAVVTMEPFTSAVLLARGTLYLSMCPRGRTLRRAACTSPSHTSGGPQYPCAASQQHSARLQPPQAHMANGAAPSCPMRPPPPLTTYLMAQAVWVVAWALRGVRIVLLACSDVLRSWLGMSAAYLPLVLPSSGVAAPRQVAAGAWWRWAAPLLLPLLPHLSMSVLADEDYNVFMAACPPRMLGGWRNLVAARTLFTYPLYHPLHQAARIHCPVLAIAGRQDSLTPPWTIQKAVERLRARGVPTTYRELDGTHITLYNNPALVPTMLGFLQEHVPLSTNTA